MFYFRSSLFKGGAKNDAKLEINFETCKSFRRFFQTFFRRPARKKHPGAPLPSLCPQPRLHLLAHSRPLRRDLPSQKRVQSYTLLLKLPNFLPRNFSKTMFFSTFFHITPLTSHLQGLKCRSHHVTIRFSAHKTDKYSSLQKS